MEQRNIIEVRLAELGEAYDLSDIYVFGSRAEEIAAIVRGSKMRAMDTTSDVDIGIRSSPGRRLAARDIVRLAIALEDLFNVSRVDLVVLHDADPFIALNIIRGNLIFTRNPADQARYELFVLRRAGDLLPLKKARMAIIMDGHGR